MNFENSINVDGKITSTKNIQSKPVTLPIVAGATVLADVVIDWSNADTYILDLTMLDLAAGSITSKLVFIGGNTDNVRNRIIIKQNNTTPPNHVAFTIEAYIDITLTTPQEILNRQTLESSINVAGKTTILELEFWDGVYQSTTTISPLADKETFTYDVHGTAPSITVNGQVLTLTHDKDISSLKYRLTKNNKEVLPGDFEIINNNVLQLTFDPIPTSADNVQIKLTKIS